MSAWFSVNLGDAMLSQPTLDELQGYLSDVYEQSGCPSTMTALYQHQSSGLHCQLILFLTSEFQQVAKVKQAVKCNLPPVQSMSYLAGFQPH